MAESAAARSSSHSCSQGNPRSSEHQCVQLVVFLLFYVGSSPAGALHKLYLKRVLSSVWHKRDPRFQEDSSVIFFLSSSDTKLFDHGTGMSESDPFNNPNQPLLTSSSQERRGSTRDSKTVPACLIAAW